LTKIQHTFNWLKDSAIQEFINIFPSDSFMFTGGLIRDSFINPNIYPQDVDIASKLSFNDNLTIAKRYNLKYIILSLNYETLRIIIQKTVFDITPLRKDIDAKGRHTEIEFIHSYQEDSNRRDFTINALYYNPHTKYLYDFHQGLQHIKAKQLYFIGNIQDRIKEDYLRILRYFRFHAKICTTKIDTNILKIFQEFKTKLKTLSKERIVSEFLKIIFENNVINTLISLKSSQIFNDFLYLSAQALKNLTLYLKHNHTIHNHTIDNINTFFILIIDEKNSNQLPFFIPKKNYKEIITIKKIITFLFNKKSHPPITLLSQYSLKDINKGIIIFNILYQKNIPLLQEYGLKHKSIEVLDLQQIGYQNHQLKPIINILITKIYKNPLISKEELLNFAKKQFHTLTSKIKYHKLQKV
jgi:tRNA nucleotidyltransferase/poly(A) polymerase